QYFPTTPSNELHSSRPAPKCRELTPANQPSIFDPGIAFADCYSQTGTVLKYDIERVIPHAWKNVTALIAIWALAVLIILPAVFHWPATTPHYGLDRYFRIGALYALVAAMAYLMYRVECRSLAKSQAFGLIFLIFLLTSVVNHFHSSLVDHGPSYFGFVSNVQWQIDMHNAVIKLSPAAVPHSYRFLPNAFVRWLQIWHLDFEFSRDFYRLMFGVLLFYAIYRYARLYTGFSGAVVALALSAVIYPISFENYAGQLTDPMAHVAFVLALIFLQTEDFGLFLSTLLIGSLAKETVLAMAGYYLLFHRRDAKYGARAVALAVLCPLTYLGVHLYVLNHGGHPAGGSGVSRIITDRTWVAILDTNLKDARWPAAVLLTGFALTPFLLVSWRTTPKSLKYAAVYVLIVVSLSNLFFSWLVETRNLMPAVFVLAVVAGRFVTGDVAQAEERGSLAETKSQHYAASTARTG
ncbi:MAG: hypothetical protein ACJ74Y_00785, partial [Bryobacteraceae bacterium]